MAHLGNSNYYGFSIPENGAVISSSYVMNDGMPVLYVIHEHDEEQGEMWQFHCDNGDYSMNRMMLVSLGNVLSLDLSLMELADLPLGHEARRNNADAEWVYSPIEDVE